jgi:hypothetical protein
MSRSTTSHSGRNRHAEFSFFFCGSTPGLAGPRRCWCRHEILWCRAFFPDRGTRSRACGVRHEMKSVLTWAVACTVSVTQSVEDTAPKSVPCSLSELAFLRHSRARRLCLSDSAAARETGRKGTLLSRSERGGPDQVVQRGDGVQLNCEQDHLLRDSSASAVGGRERNLLPRSVPGRWISGFPGESYLPYVCALWRIPGTQRAQGNGSWRPGPS